jgi:hypothetical protein
MTLKLSKDQKIRRLEGQLKALAKEAIKARRFIANYAPMMESERIEALDKALKKAGFTAAFTDKELASQPCRDPGAGGCIGPCETCAARGRLYRDWKSNSP